MKKCLPPENQKVPRKFQQMFKADLIPLANTLDITIRKYKKYPSIQMIKENVRIPKNFSFQPVSKDEVKKIVKDLENNTSVGGEIQKKILKECDFTFQILRQCVNKSFASGELPDCLKQTKISPTFKKEGKKK